jgi:hypothetical protein
LVPDSKCTLVIFALNWSLYFHFREFVLPSNEKYRMFYGGVAEGSWPSEWHTELTII